MSTDAAGSPEQATDLSTGLLGFYSSQAAVMLAQFENIEQLLGDTHDWTSSGDYCEILLRDYLRKYLPASISADKGFFHGRTARKGKDSHCPEIDILLHDSHAHRPIFRMGDFVIVKPQAVRGIIQVKRTLTTTSVAEGMENVVAAKQHLYDVLWTGHAWGTAVTPPRIFTAVVGFNDDLGDGSTHVRDKILELYRLHRGMDRPGMHETGMLVLPNLVGSLKRRFVTTAGRINYINSAYYAFGSLWEGSNVFIQSLLADCHHIMRGGTDENPPFSFPQQMKPSGRFFVLGFTASTPSPDSITLERNDGWAGEYRLVQGATVPFQPPPTPVDAKHHLEWLPPSTLTTTDLLRTDLTPDALLVKREDGVERYERISMRRAPGAPPVPRPA